MLWRCEGASALPLVTRHTEALKEESESVLLHCFILFFSEKALSPLGVKIVSLLIYESRKSHPYDCSKPLTAGVLKSQG